LAGLVKNKYWVSKHVGWIEDSRSTVEGKKADSAKKHWADDREGWKGGKRNKGGSLRGISLGRGEGKKLKKVGKQKERGKRLEGETEKSKKTDKVKKGREERERKI
jgi:hypothetical protein